ESVEPQLDNDGTVAVETGTLRLAAGDAGTTNGKYTISSGATLLLNNKFQAPSIAGAGTVTLAGGKLTIGATDKFEVPALHTEGGAELTLEKTLSLPKLISTA